MIEQILEESQPVWFGISHYEMKEWWNQVNVGSRKGQNM